MTIIQAISQETGTMPVTCFKYIKCLHCNKYLKLFSHILSFILLNLISLAQLSWHSVS